MLNEEAQRVEIPVRGSCKTFRPPIVPQLGLMAGVVLFASLGPVAEQGVAEPHASAPAKPVAVVAVTSPRTVAQATLELQRTNVTKATIKLDLAAIRPVEFGDWEEVPR